MLKALKKIFSKTSNIIFASIIFLVTTIAILSFPSISLIVRVSELFEFTSSNFWNSIFDILYTSFAIQSALNKIIFILFVLISSLNIVVFFVYLRVYRQRINSVQTHLSFFGFIFAFLGTGCLSCSIILIAPLTSLFGFAAATWISRYGSVIGFAGLLMVIISLYLLLRKISHPSVCGISK